MSWKLALALVALAVLGFAVVGGLLASLTEDALNLLGRHRDAKDESAPRR